MRRIQADAQSDANGGQAQGVWRFPPRVPQPAGGGGGQERPVMPCNFKGSVCVRHNTTDLGSDLTMHAHTKNIHAINVHAHTASTNNPRVKTRCSLRRLRFASPTLSSWPARQSASTARHPRAPNQPRHGSLCQVELDSVANAAAQHAAHVMRTSPSASSPPIACWSSSTCRGGSHPCGSAAPHIAPMHRPARRRRPARRCSPR